MSDQRVTEQTGTGQDGAEPAAEARPDEGATPPTDTAEATAAAAVTEPSDPAPAAETPAAETPAAEAAAPETAVSEAPAPETSAPETTASEAAPPETAEAPIEDAPDPAAAADRPADPPADVVEPAPAADAEIAAEVSGPTAADAVQAEAQPTAETSGDRDPASPVPADEAAAPAPGPQSEATPARPGPPPRPMPGPPRPGPDAVPPKPAPPRPGAPKPPRSGPARPAAAPAEPVAPQPSPVPAASTAPDRWGRVDDEGLVYLVTADGERSVGSWQAGEPVEGLAHFARRFDDLRAEAELLAARITAGGDPKQALGSARTLREGLAEAAVVGDVVGLGSRLDEIVAAAEEAVGAARAARDAQRAAAVARKEELAAEAEELAGESTQWKQAGDRFKAILDEWRAIRGIDRKVDEQLWKRFSRAREAFNRRRGSHFADLDRQRAGAKAYKQELVTEAEKLAGSEDWGPTAARFRDLMAEWKAAGRAQKDSDDTLWQRFRTAQDSFFARRAETFAERDAEFAANAESKKALLTEAEKIDTSDPAGARAALRHVQERWEEIGKVPRDDIRSLEARLRAVEEKVRDAADRQWRRTDPEAEARVAQFRERVAQFEAQAEKAHAAGDRRRAEQAESQAATWREWLATAEQAVQHR